jgi:hypothetical protein
MTYRGNVDGLFEGAVHGWAYDSDRPGDRVEVTIRTDGKQVARATADRHRDDLQGHGIGDGRHGFRIPAPPGIPKFRLSVHFGDSDELVPGSFADNISIARRLQLPLAENPLMEDLIAEDGLTDQQAGLVRAFARDGFLKFRITDPAFDALADAAIRDVDWKRSNGIRLQDAWTDVEAVRRLAALPEVMDLLQLLYGRPAVPFQTLSFRVGTQQETHSDSLHFSSRPSRFMCGVWIALEPVDADNGALHYFPGSHKLPIFELNDLGLLGDEAELTPNYAIYCDMLQAMIRAHGLSKQVALMDRGEAIVWAANLYHGGDPIRDPSRTRFSQVTHYYFEGCAYYAPLSSDPYLNRYVRPDRRDVRTGEPIGHWFGTRPVDAAAGKAAQPAPAGRSWLGRLLGG